MKARIETEQHPQISGKLQPIYMQIEKKLVVWITNISAKGINDYVWLAYFSQYNYYYLEMEQYGEGY